MDYLYLSRNLSSFIKIVKFDGINLFIVFPYNLSNFCEVISDVPFLIYDFGNLLIHYSFLFHQSS